MRHQIFAGPFAALEARLLEAVAGAQATNPLAPVSILVGSNILAVYLRGRLAARGRGAVNVRFYTFIDLVSRLAGARSPQECRPRLSALAAARILEDVLSSHAAAAFREVVSLAGFRAALLDTFRDLRDAGIGLDVLSGAVRTLAQRSPDRANHLQGISELYGRFREAVSGFRDVDEDFRLAESAAPEAPRCLRASDLLVYGFYDVTGQQGDLLRALAGHMGLTYFVPFSGEISARFAEPFLRSREVELAVACRHLTFDAGPSSLSRLAAQIFASAWREPGTAGTPAAPLADDGSFALVSVPGDSRAAVEVVREILSAVRGGVIAGFQEAAVILRHPEDQLPLLTEALRTRGIPYYVHGGSSFARRPLARAVLALASLGAEEFSRRAILAAMELVAAALPPAGSQAWEVSEWRALTNDPRYLSGADAWEHGTRALVEEVQRLLRAAEEGTIEEGDRDGKIAPVGWVRRRLQSAQSLRGGWSALWQAAGAWPAELSWRQWARHLRERLQPLLGSSEDWEPFSTALDDISRLEQNGGSRRWAPISRERMVEALTEALAALQHPEGRFQQRGVNLLSTAAARGLRFLLVVIPGLEEGQFPSRLRQDPLLLDAERRQVGDPPRLPMKSLRIEEERLLFDMAVRSAERRLVLMSSRLDEGADRERMPSDFYLRAAAAARGAAISLYDLSPESVPGLRSVGLENPAPAAGWTAVDHGEIRLRLITEDPRASRERLEAMAAAEPALLRGPLDYDRARWREDLTSFDGRFVRPELRAWLAQYLGASAGQVSASRIEDYARCPYMFYLKRAIGLAGWEEVEAALAFDPLERGRVMHRILERFLSSAAGLPFGEMWRSLEPLAHDELDRARPAGVPDLLWEIERDGLLRLLYRWLEFERDREAEGLRPVLFELAFGRMGIGEETPPMTVPAGRHTFQFRGRIDRIDLSDDRRSARVIDYKIGRLPESMSRGERPLLMAGEKLQLAVYRCALAVLRDLGRVENVAGEYLYLQPRDCDAVSCGDEDGRLREAADRLPRMLEIIGDLIEEGVFLARSSGSIFPRGHCQYCDYLMICGKDRVQREERKSRDATARRFTELQMIDEALPDHEQ